MGRYVITLKDKNGDKDKNKNNKLCLSVWKILSY